MGLSCKISPNPILWDKHLFLAQPVTNRHLSDLAFPGASLQTAGDVLLFERKRCVPTVGNHRGDIRNGMWTMRIPKWGSRTNRTIWKWYLNPPINKGLRVKRTSSLCLVCHRVLKLSDGQVRWKPTSTHHLLVGVFRLYLLFPANSRRKNIMIAFADILLLGGQRFTARWAGAAAALPVFCWHIINFTISLAHLTIDDINDIC